MNDNLVSFSNELLILVDENDRVVGYKTKNDCHNGDGILHRAFSVFIFRKNGKLILQQRSAVKRLWSRFWSNSCCSHPRKGESYEVSTQRRILEELGLKTELKYLYNFVYQAKFGDIGSEYENCAVFIGSCDDDLHINPNEISSVKEISPDDMDREFETNSELYTPWFKLEWKALRTQHWAEVEKLFK